MDADIDNIRAGWHWAVQAGHTEAVRKPIRALWFFYDMRGWFQEAEASFAWASENIHDAFLQGNEVGGFADLLQIGRASCRERV